MHSFIRARRRWIRLVVAVTALWAGAGALAAPHDDVGPIRADQARLRRARLMLTVPTELPDLAGSLPYVQRGLRSQVWAVKPHDGDWLDATELAVTFAPGAAPAMVGLNRVVFALQPGATVDDAAALVTVFMPLADAPRPRPGRAVFMVDTPTAKEAFELADRLAHTPGVRFAHPDAVSAITLDGAPRGSGAEVRVMFGGVEIASGGEADFGDVTQGSSQLRQFVVVNDGGSTLTLDSLSASGAFHIDTGFGSTSLLAGQSTSFTLLMNTATPGAATGTVSFLNNDDDENPYEIDLVGMVTAAAGPAEISVSLGGVELTPAQTVGFGSTPAGVGVERVFRVSNVGGAPLTVGTVSVPPGFAVSEQPTSPVVGGAFTEFRVRMTAAVPGTPTGELSFLNSDADENPFTLLVSGEVTDENAGAQMVVLVNGAPLANGGLLSFGAADWLMPVLKTIELKNTGTEELRLLFLTLPPGYSLRNFPSEVIPPEQSGFLDITLDAETDGPFGGELFILTTAQDLGEFRVDLTGVVTTPPPTGGVDDLEFVRQWHLLNTGQQGGVAGYDIRVSDAWALTLGEDVVVGMLDSGVQLEHPELRNRIAGEFLNNFDYLEAFFGAGGSHGTCVAGLVAAEANYYGGRGVAPSAKLFTSSIFNTDADAAAAMYAAHDAGAAIHTNSWGYSDPTLLPDVMRDAVEDLAANGREGKGVCFFFSAGNDARPLVWRSTMACLPQTIAVSAVTNQGRRSDYSNIGPWVDVAAPSSGGTVALFTTDVTGASGYNQQQSHITGDFAFTFTGTSGSTPLVAGTAALMLSVNPDLYAEQVRRILRHTARRDLSIGDDRRFGPITRYSDSFGHGLIDAAAAVNAAAEALDNGGQTWPAPAQHAALSRVPSGNHISWTNPSAEDPSAEYAGALLVSYSNQTLWRPEDGVSYEAFIGRSPSIGVTVHALGDLDSFQHDGVTLVQKLTYAVYTFNAAHRYGEPAIVAANPIEPHVVFFDNMENEDPGWTYGPIETPGGGGTIPGSLHGEWERAAPDTATIDLEGFFKCASAACDPALLWGNPIPYPEAIAEFTAPYSGFKVLATDARGVYTPSSDHVVVSPIIDLTDTTYGSYSLSFRELLDTEGAPFDFAFLRVIDADTGFVIRTLLDKHQNLAYEWREQWFDLRNQRGRRIRLVFNLQSDNQNQFHGWFIDDVRVAASVYTPPSGNQPRRIILPGVGIPEVAADAGTGGDLNDDDLIDFDDLAVLLDRWGETRDLTWFSFDADLDGNGRIGVGDVAVMLALIGNDDSSRPRVEPRGM